MKKYNVEMRTNNTEEFQNWLNDYVPAENEVEALELAKQWLIDNGYNGDPETDLEYSIEEVR